MRRVLQLDLDPAKSVDGDAYPKKLVLGNDTSVLQKSSLTNQPPTDVVGLIPESALQALLGEYADVLSAPPEDREIGHIAVGHTIPLVPGAVPPFRRAPRLSPKEEAAARAHIAEMIKKKYISPSKSLYGAPIIFTTKPVGGLRVVCDYRMLNKLTIKNRYPLPRIDELLDHIGGRKIFSSLDLLDGYYQIAITPQDQHKTAFTTPFGHYEFKVLAQGLCNSPSTFQKVMNDVFADYIYDFVVIYLDDILVMSRTPEEHLHHLRLVFERLRLHKIYAKMSKCHFNRQEVKFLGHIVGHNGLRVDPAKIAVVKEWPVPTNITELRQFWGLANYFRKFIQGYSSLAAPLTSALTNLTSRSRPAFILNASQIATFNAIKHALCTAPVLRPPDFSKPFEVISDASILGTGAVLMQDDHPIAYTSSKYIPAEINYTTGEQELLAVFKALRVWRCYLEGTKSTLITDHNPLTHIQEQPPLSRRQARWMEYLARFDYDWKYRPGRLNVADPISRNPTLGLVFVSFAAATRAATKALLKEKNRKVPLVTPRTRGNKVPVVRSFYDRVLEGYALDPWFADLANTDRLTLSPEGFLAA